MDNINLGKFGEDVASEYLENIGYKIKERNYRTFLGEIDIVCEYKGSIIFVEVKTRRSNKFGYPEEAVNPSKQRKIIKNALCYMSKHHLWGKNCSFDVIIIKISNHENTKDIKHIKNAFCLDSKLA